MVLDQFSILVAIGFSGASLGLTLFMMWAVGRSDTHLLDWSAGLALIVAGVILFGGIIEKFNDKLLLASFVLLIVGFGLVYAGSAKFCSSRTSWRFVVAIVAIGVSITLLAFATGYSGIGTIAGNVAIGTLLALSAYQYWLARVESPFLMIMNAALYVITAASFMACGYALAEQGQFILTARPANWAEDINSLIVIAGLTGIGTLSLTLNQTRIANRHKSDAMTDPLTGLLNRRALLDSNIEFVPAGTAVIMMDLDHFKTINDQFGHDAGDQVLKTFAQLVRANIRAHDLAALIGGEEFCLVLSDSNPRAAASVAERIRSQIEAMTISTSFGPIRATISAGICIRSTEIETLQALLSRTKPKLQVVIALRSPASVWLHSPLVLMRLRAWFRAGQLWLELDRARIFVGSNPALRPGFAASGTLVSEIQEQLKRPRCHFHRRLPPHRPVQPCRWRPERITSSVKLMKV